MVNDMDEQKKKLGDMSYYLTPYRLDLLARATAITGERSRTKVIDRALTALIGLHSNRTEFIDGMVPPSAKAIIGTELFEKWIKGGG